MAKERAEMGDYSGSSLLNRDPLIAAARALWDYGLAVVPILAGTKRPSIEGWQERRLDWSELAKLLADGRVGGLGVVAGALSGNLAVLDFDGDGWRDAFDVFCESWPELTDAPTVVTGSGKRHLWVICPDMPATFTSHPYRRPDLNAVIELRGNRSNCIAPPSTHPSGGRYAWAKPPEAKLREIAFGELEAWLREWAGEPERDLAPTVQGDGAHEPTADELVRVQRALDALAAWRCDAYDARGGWLGVGFALSELGDEGLRLWETWSRRSPKYEAGMCARKWPTMRPGRGIGLGSLYYWARLDGGLEPNMATDLKPPPLEADAVPPPKGGYRPTDMGNAERFVATWRGKVLWSAGLGWLWWDGKRWVPDQLERVMAMAKTTARRIGLEAMSEESEARRQTLIRWWATSENVARVAAMIELAKSDLAMPTDAFDANPYLLNCVNGTLDLRDATLHPHDPNDLITKLCPVAYAPEATHPVWDRFLADATGGDAAFGAFLQRLAGYALTGDTSEEIFALVLGTAGTGKSTFLEALLSTWGDYGRKCAFDTFLARRDVGVPRPDLVALRGARLVAAVETAPARSLDSPAIKELTGGDRITTRSLYREEITFTPQCKLLLAANDAPKMSDLDAGLWRRLRKVPFEHVVAEPDPTVKDTLKKAAVAGPAILAWAVRGCLDWQRDRLGTCDEVKRATAQLRLDFDPLAEFFSECCVFGPAYEVSAKVLRDTYEAWAHENGAKGGAIVGNQEWGRRLADKGCERAMRRKDGTVTRLWLGVGLAAPPDEDIPM